MIQQEAEIAIVGAGLSGLALADMLTRQGREVVVLEARDRVGGRVLSRPATVRSQHQYDLGPAWIWPHNHRMLALVERFDLELIGQNSAGNLVFQDGYGVVRRDYAFATMGDALRVKGGIAKLTQALVIALPPNAVRLGHRVEKISRTQDGVTLAVAGPNSAMGLVANQVVLAMPPRLAATGLQYDPPLSDVSTRALTGVPTWMAAQAKVVAVYPSAFWLQAGLSGDAISHRGPLVEVHDASPAETPNGEAALFGFVHPSAIPDGAEDDAFRASVVNQLIALFGDDAAEPTALLIKTWASDQMTATHLDTAGITSHPDYQPIQIRDEAWAELLLLAGSEVASDQGGFLEGALAAAEESKTTIVVGSHSSRQSKAKTTHSL